MQQNIINTEQRFCYKCHYPAGAADSNCQRCGSRSLKTKTAIRTLGGLLVALGGFISLMMAAVMSFMVKTLAWTDDPKLKGEETEMMFAFGIIGLTFAVGLAFAAAGVWQMIFGRRNAVIVYLALIMVVILLIGGRIFSLMV